MDKELFEKLYNYIKENDLKYNQISEVIGNLQEYINSIDLFNDELLIYIVCKYFNIDNTHEKYLEIIDLVSESTITHDKDISLDDLISKINKLIEVKSKKVRKKKEGGK